MPVKVAKAPSILKLGTSLADASSDCSTAQEPEQCGATTGGILAPSNRRRYALPSPAPDNTCRTAPVNIDKVASSSGHLAMAVAQGAIHELHDFEMDALPSLAFADPQLDLRQRRL